jgi:hypothetical protein
MPPLWQYFSRLRRHDKADELISAPKASVPAV